MAEAIRPDHQQAKAAVKSAIGLKGDLLHPVSIAWVLCVHGLLQG